MSERFALLSALIAAAIAVASAGCTTAPRSALPAANIAHDSSIERESASGHQNQANEIRKSKAQPNPITLDAYEVKEAAFSDFGMSVKTNLEVKFGRRIEWMRVSAVAAGSSASRMGIMAGDRILAIDGRMVTDMDRDAMLDRLFQRKKGDTTRLLVLGPKEGFPHFVTLIASRFGV